MILKENLLENKKGRKNMAFIIVIALIIYFINIAWTWKSLGEIEKSQKVIFIIVGLLILFIITLITFNISTRNIQYQHQGETQLIRNVLVAIFTGINGIIIMPQLAKILEKAKNGDLEKNQIRNRIILWIIVLIICIIFECGYMESTQQGIVNIQHSLQNSN